MQVALDARRRRASPTRPQLLKASRPTAVNLAWAVDRVQAAVLAVAPRERAAVARAEAEAIHAAEDAASATIAGLGADLLAGTRRILTHCNTGTLACGGTRLGAGRRHRARARAASCRCSPARRGRCCRARG